MSHAIGIDLGGTNVKSVVVKMNGEVLERHRFETADDASNPWAASVKSHVRELEQKHGQAACIGIASPGLAARDGRTIAWMRGRMAGVQGFDWTRHLERDAPVPVLNDAHAALLGEVWQGAARGLRDAVLLTLGTGVGGAIYCDGRILKGHLGRAGHLGHISMDVDGALDIVKTPGSLEDAVGDHSIRHRTGGRFNSTRELVEAGRNGDAAAAGLWRRSIHVLACGIVSIVNAVDPEAIVIGGGIASAGEDLFGPLREALDRIEWRPTDEPVRLVPAALGDASGALGAAWNAVQLQKENQ